MAQVVIHLHAGITAKMKGEQGKGSNQEATKTAATTLIMLGKLYVI